MSKEVAEKETQSWVIFFILVMEILVLLLRENSKEKLYKTKFGLKHFIDMYADDLSVYLEFKKNRELDNKSNVQCFLQAMKKFREWLGLKINLGKTYLTIFGKQYRKPRFDDELEIKWCVEFKLLGIYFDSTLSKMHINYDMAGDSI